MQDEREAKENQSKIRSIVGRWIAIAFSVFVIYSMATLRIQELQQLSFFLGFAFVAALALFSAASNFLMLAFVAVTSLLSFDNFFFACPSLYLI